MDLFLLAALGALVQVANDYVVGLLDPSSAFLLTYAAATLGFVVYRWSDRRQFLESEHWGYTWAITLLGQVAAPLLYFRGVYLTDLLTQSVIYPVYPAVVLISARLMYREAAGRQGLLALAFLVGVVGLQAGLAWAAAGDADPKGVAYLLGSAACLVGHKLLHMRALVRVSSLNPVSLSFVGLLAATVAGFVLTWFGPGFASLFGAPRYLSGATAQGLAFYAMLLVLAASLPVLNFRRNTYVLEHGFFQLFAGTLSIPLWAVLLGNVLALTLPRGEIDARIFGPFGVVMGLLLLASRSRLLLAGLAAVAGIAQYQWISATMPTPVNLWVSDKIAVLYDEPRRFGVLVQRGDSWWLHRNRDDFDVRHLAIEAVGLARSLTVQSVLQPRRLYELRTLGLGGGRIDVRHVVDRNTFRRHVLKPIDSDTARRMRLLHPKLAEFPFLAPFDLVEHGGQEYVLTTYLYGVTFEDYFAQYDGSYLTPRKESELLSAIREAARISLALNEAGWIDRDIHARNLMLTPTGWRIVDYDFMFPVAEVGWHMVDSYGFRHHLYDIYGLLTAKAEAEQRKFQYRAHVPLAFSERAAVRNANLERISAAIQDNSYLYSDNCGSEPAFATGMRRLLDELERLDEARDSTAVKRRPLDTRGLTFAKACVIQAPFIGRTGKRSFTVYRLPGEVFSHNVLELHNFELADLDLPVNRQIAESLQDVANGRYIVVGGGQLDLGILADKLSRFFGRPIILERATSGVY